MRLQLTFAAVVLAGCTASPEVRSTSTAYHTYTDDSVTVHSPRVDASVGFDHVSVSPYWTADVISAATPVASEVDVVSQATTYTEVRNEAGLGIRLEESERSVGGSYRLSREPDYTSHTGSVSATHEILDRQATVRIQSRVGMDTVERVDSQEFARDLVTAGADLAWSHIINPELVLHLAYSLEHRRGFQANPYRYVAVYDGATERAQFLLPESVPDERTRHAVEGLAIWSLSPHVYWRSAYRFYADGWGIRSHTVRTNVWYEVPGDRLRLRASLRLYGQSAADFFASRYTSADGFRSGDYKLSQMESLVGGLRAEVLFPNALRGAHVRWHASYHYRAARFSDFPTRDTLNAHVFGTSLALEVP